MLIFNRKEFRSGVIICEELIPISAEKAEVRIWRFYTKDKGKPFEFKNEKYMLEKYPHMFKTAP